MLDLLNKTVLVGIFDAFGTPGDSSHETGFVSGMIEHFPDHETSSGFAVSTGNANNVEFFGWMFELCTGTECLKIVIRKDQGIICGDFIFNIHKIIIQQR